MKITRLGWAGLELEAGGATAVVDLFQHLGTMAEYVGEFHTPMPGPSQPGQAVAAFVTHLHEDHTDGEAIAAALAPDGVLLRPVAADGEFLEIAGTLAAERKLTELGVTQRVVEPWETVEVGPFRATALPAVDGFGDPQLSWVIEAEGTRILHAGDTLFHGWWWRARMRLGPIDYAFLPANGPLVSLPHRQPTSTRPAVMTPAEAAAAAAILEAGEVIPIHYDGLYLDPIYVQTDDPAGQLLREAAALGVSARAVDVGAEVTANAGSRR